MTSGIMAFLHHLAAFVLTAAIVYERWNKSFAKNQAPEIPDRGASRIKMLLRLELLAIVLILFSAAMMARGVGMMQ
ncbi:MAG TPA: DUF2214 family protein [Anaerolineales bacterium]|nr:DUF2214 family protein [Anaerolineales bacterium]